MMTQDEVLKELKQGIYRPMYLLMGSEPYPIDVVSNYIEQHALDASQRDFNQLIIYGRDTNGRQVGLECAQYPSFADRRVVVVREAQSMPGFTDLDKYVSNARATTVLVLCYKYKSVDKRLKILKSIDAAGGAIMETKKLYDNQMPQWIATFANRQGLSIEDKAATLLAEHVGTSMSDAAAAFEKIRSAVGPSLKTVTVDMVSTHTGISKEYNMSELRDALFRKDRLKAMRIVKAFGQNEKAYPVQPIFATLYYSFDHLFSYTYTRATTGSDDAAVKAAIESGVGNPYMVTKIFAPAARLYSAKECMRITTMLATYDMRSKGYNFPDTSNRDLLVDVVSRILD